MKPWSCRRSSGVACQFRLARPETVKAERLVGEPSGCGLDLCP
jgi:hypothetical protein